MKGNILLLVIIVSVISCKKENTAPFSALIVNGCESATIKGQVVKICLDSVINDSRCPVNAVCIRRGSALARFTISINGAAPETHELWLKDHEPLDNPWTVIVNDYQITFHTLLPYPGANNYSYNSFRAGLEVIAL